MDNFKMTAKEIYTKIKREVTDGIYNYDDQLVAISKWVESELNKKAQMCQRQSRTKK